MGQRRSQGWACVATFDKGTERKLPLRPHDIPTPEPLKKFMEQGWAPSPLDGLKKSAVTPFAVARRAKLSIAFPGKRLVIPAGTFKTRSNDTDYRFRPHTTFEIGRAHVWTPVTQ